MNGSEKLFELGKDLLAQLPSLLVLLVCMIVAIARWHRHPKVSGLLLLSLAMLLAQGILYSVVYTWVPDLLINSADPVNSEHAARNAYIVLGLLSNTPLAAAFIVLLAAIFAAREPVKQR